MAFHLFIGEVKLVHNYGIDVIVWKEVVDAGLVPDVLKEDVQGLKQLDADVVVADLLVHDLQEEAQHVSLQEEVKHRAVILVSPDKDFWDEMHDTLWLFLTG